MDDRRAYWRGNLAIKPEWNQNGNYVTYTYNKATDGEIKVWEGPVAAQWVNDKKIKDGFYEGGWDQVVFHPKEQIKGIAQDDYQYPVKFPDMVEGGAVPSGVRKKIKDARIKGPFPTGWGYKDFKNQHDLIGLPNPNRD